MGCSEWFDVSDIWHSKSSRYLWCDKYTLLTLPWKITLKSCRWFSNSKMFLCFIMFMSSQGSEIPFSFEGHSIININKALLSINVGFVLKPERNTTTGQVSLAWILDPNTFKEIPRYFPIIWFVPKKVKALPVSKFLRKVQNLNIFLLCAEFCFPLPCPEAV